ncbi:ABC transporter substrate-binding protein [Paenibacillus oceani]|uniref:Extracellular solute-binding protein n=1 Tax=Paenibacillus oceani TaxID=2772510 RepID=A0A927GZ99_9BACL|nr:extracellular solute-binding protein [Paenibacillus oceani]MBD2861244.1 extracellular solute-binding protein [Paenibacillus oceani]
MKERLIPMTALVCSIGLMSACGGNEGTVANSPKTVTETKGELPAAGIDKPTELNIYYMYSNWTDEDFMKSFGSLIQRKYPNVTFKLTQKTKGSTIQDMVTAKADMDIIIASQSQIFSLGELGLLTDISDLIKANKFDLSRLELSAVENLRKITNGSIVGLPYKINAMAMYYNRDIFDKFGVPYMKDGLSWDDVYETARKLTRLEGGVQYWGISLNFYQNFLTLNQYSHELINPKTRVPTFTDHFWKGYMENFVRFAEIPSNGLTREILNKQNDLFVKDKTLAIMLSTIGGVSGLSKESSHLNWDIAAYPVFKDIPDMGPPPAPTYMLLSATSKQKREAFLAMAEMLSDESQLALSKLGNATALSEKSIRESFGDGLVELKGKNVKALLPSKMAVPITWNNHTIVSQNAISNAFADVLLGAKDMNTALREAQEEAEKAIAELK